MTAIRTFYENLYISNIDHSSNGFYDFGCNLQCTKLSDEEKITLDGEITLEECETISHTIHFKMGNHQGMMVIQLSSTNNFSVSYVRIWLIVLMQPLISVKCLCLSEEELSRFYPKKMQICGFFQMGVQLRY